MTKTKDLKISQFDQINPYSCIPACLQEVFSYYKKQISQEKILDSLEHPERGMAVAQAGFFAKKSGFKPTVITNNISIFDPIWFSLTNVKLIDNLEKRKKFVDKYNQALIDAYIKYIEATGTIKFESISADLLKKYLSQNIPIIIELASTYLYKKAKSTRPGAFDNAFKGDIEGHGVVIAGFNGDKFKIVDPNSRQNPYNKSGIYWIPGDELMTSFSLLDGKSILIIK